MIRRTTFKMAFTLDDKADVKIKKDDGKLRAFSVNYRTRVGNKWHDVIRYDTAHGMIHVHKFWISPGMSQMGELAHENMKTAIIEAVKDVKLNWERYKNYFVGKARKDEK